MTAKPGVDRISRFAEDRANAATATSTLQAQAR
ncbi:hypothetical protein RCH17_001862 [Arthrobacter sp. MP_M7]|nr:hypothetical protein [Arthrobacter sp. MP_M4]MEC5203055.1 hypothetical protein [Arthrobacter sp. MP_M7]